MIDSGFVAVFFSANVAVCCWFICAIMDFLEGDKKRYNGLQL
jgi:hypothetical protein